MGQQRLRRLILVMGMVLVVGLACSTGASPTATPTIVSSLSSTATPSASPPAAAGPLLPSVSTVAAKVTPSVVSIVVKTVIQQCDFFFGCRNVEQDSAGTGVIFDSKGLIVTNNHVVEGADEITVILGDERTFEAELVGRDPDSDLAVIKIPQGSYDAVEFADSDTLKVGDWVVAIGNALALEGGPTVTLGIVGALDRTIDTEGSLLFDMIQTDAAINPGNSGGPLVNMEGRVVGINTARTTGGEGIGFAVSTFTVVPVVESILEHGRVVFAWLGVGVRDVTPVIAAQENLSVSRGVLVTRVDPGPAAAAGVRAGDVITAFDGAEVNTIKQLQRAIRGHDIGYKAEVTIVRGKETRSFRVTLEEQPRGL
ncbi:MAG: trypsin-like peptidase domain-containing protein [Chloroflexi bacterium]|nr:trypsin-like peptidase domain-containing protein [Chloroflexota bacterium]